MPASITSGINKFWRRDQQHKLDIVVKISFLQHSKIDAIKFLAPNIKHDVVERKKHLLLNLSSDSN